MTMTTNEKYLLFFIIILLIIVIYKVCSNKNENFDKKCINKSGIVDNVSSLKTAINNYDCKNDSDCDNAKKNINNTLGCWTESNLQNPSNLFKCFEKNSQNECNTNCQTEVHAIMNNKNIKSLEDNFTKSINSLYMCS
jgi:hypothetical protein